MPADGNAASYFDRERTYRRWFIVRCRTCGHKWDEDDPDSEVCACLDEHGHREVAIVSAGASNV